MTKIVPHPPSPGSAVMSTDEETGLAVLRVFDGKAWQRYPFWSDYEALRAERDSLAQSLSDVAGLLHDLWRCNTDDERRELGQQVKEAVEKYSKHPSWLVSKADTK